MVDLDYIDPGIDYALTDQWTTNVEYDYIRTPHTTVSFPEISVINNQSYSVTQTMSMVKVGLNYKLR